jgi:spore coat protein U-like protein
MSRHFSAVLGFACALFLAAAQAANTIPAGVSATVLSKSNCKFPVGSLVLAFGAVDPAGSANAAASSSTTFTCAGSAPTATFLITQDGGLYVSAGNRMQHATLPGVFLPYTLNLTPTSGTAPKNIAQTLTITGSITATDYQQAIAGNYTDTVTLTISP